MVNRPFWEGQASDLDNRLRAITGNLGGAKNWPTDPRTLANTLRQQAPSLLKVGIEVRFHRARDRDRKRLITITASTPETAIKEEANSPSAASTIQAPGRLGLANDAGSDDHASAFPGTTS